MPAEAPIPPAQFRDILVAAGFKVATEDEWAWVLSKESVPEPIIIPKDHELVPLGTMMDALHKAQITPGVFLDLKKKILSF